ncbi:hypothetical protein PG984_014871 [Apiospora sp. TS-2023a]
MDFPKLPTEVLLVLFEHVAPDDLLNLVQASPRCLRLLESIGSTGLQKLFERTVSGTWDQEIVHFHRPVAGLNALTSLVTANGAEYDLGIFLCRPGTPPQANNMLLRRKDNDHPLSIGRVVRASDGLSVEIKRQGFAHLEDIKGALIKHYGPFFSEGDLAASNQRWDRDHRENEKLDWRGRYSDALPRTFGCDVGVSEVVDGRDLPLFALRMKACRDVVRFSVLVRDAKEGDTEPVEKSFYDSFDLGIFLHSV